MFQPIEASFLKLLVVDDEPSIGEIFTDVLGQWGYPVEVAFQAADALEKMEHYQPHVVFLDVWLQKEKEGVELFYQIKQKWPETEVILISGHATVDLAVNLVKDGAWDFIEKPISLERLKQSLERLQEYWSEKSQKQALLAQFQHPDGLAGVSLPVVEVRQRLATMMQAPGINVIWVPFGFDPRWVWVSAHSLGPYPWKPLIHWNAQMLPEGLWKSYLLGQRPTIDEPWLTPVKGVFQQAAGGTLAVLNAHQLPRELWDAWVFSVQSSKPKDELLWPFSYGVFKVLLISSDEGWFKQAISHFDGFRIPTLRQRLPEDGPILWEHLGQSVAQKLNQPFKSIAPVAFAEMSQYDWPGDIFEFEHWIQTLYLYHQGAEISESDFKRFWTSFLSQRRK